MCRGSGSISHDLGDAAANSEICDYCGGAGELPGLDKEPCARCGGDKRYHSDHEFQTQAEVDEQRAAYMMAARSKYGARCS